MTPDDARHGTSAGYDAHRNDNEPACFACRRGAADYEYRRRIDGILGKTRTQPGLGTARRIQALVTLGWTYGQIGDAIGRSHDYARKIALRPDSYVRTTTADLVAAAYERMSMTLPPQRNGRDVKATKHALKVAARNGWAPPLAWDDIDNDPEPQFGGHDHDVDPVVVMRLLEGCRIKSTRGEREEAIRRWVEDGGTKTELCNIHGWEPGRYQVQTRLTLVRGGAA